MKDAAQSMLEALRSSRMRTRELETKLAQLPAHPSPEILALYENLLAREKKFQAKMALAMAPPPKKKLSRFWTAIALFMLAFLVYLKFFSQA